MQSESILLAYANGDSTPEEIAAEWESELDACDRPDSFDFDAAGAAVREWAASNRGTIERQLADFRALADRGELNWNDESAAEFDSAPMRLYLHDSWHGEPDAYRHGRVVAMRSGAVALVLLDSPHSAWADSEASELALAAMPDAGAVWDSLAFPIGEREREAPAGVYPLASPPIAGPGYIPALAEAAARAGELIGATNALEFAAPGDRAAGWHSQANALCDSLQLELGTLAGITGDNGGEPGAGESLWAGTASRAECAEAAALAIARGANEPSPIGEPVGPWALVANTTRAAYWHKPGCGYLAAHADAEAPAPDYAAGYARLDSLMRLKGESSATIARTCQPDGSHKESGK